MSYKALYRTYRPTSFSDVVGQKHIVATLQNAVKQNKIAHAYLFCGPRGTGKTSIAKLLAKAVNCIDHENAPCGVCESCCSVQKGNHPDIIEIDAASNNGVDEIRDLIEKVKYSPIEGKYKVYIIDEVHMLSTGAFNALLKTLEEPPSHVLFVLATTEPHKVLPTIISRCQRYDFTKVENDEITKRIQLILKEENIQCEDEAIRLISILSDGGVRDALSILDQCIAYAQNNITCAHVNEIYGITTMSDKLNVLNCIFNQDAKTVLNQIKIWSDKGVDIKRLTSDLIEIIKESVIYYYTKDTSLLNKLTENDALVITSQVGASKLLELIQTLMETTEKYRNAVNVSSYFEVAILKMVSLVDKGSEQIKPVIMPVPVMFENRKHDSPVEIKKEEIAEEILQSQSFDLEHDITKESIIEDNFVSEEIQVLEEPVIIQSLDQLEIEELVIAADVVIEESIELNIQEVKMDSPKADSALDKEYILGLMVQGNKQEKLNDIEKWSNIATWCRDIECAKNANMLRFTSIGVSSEDFVLLCTDDQALVNEICETKKELEGFIKDKLNINKRLFIITSEEFNELTSLFIERKKMGTLPNPVVIEKREVVVEEENKCDPNLVQLINLFGNDFDIIEEEN